MKKTLVFYRGRAPKGEKSNWVMHEYRLEGMFSYHHLSKTAKDDWVISRVFQKSGSGKKSFQSVFHRNSLYLGFLPPLTAASEVETGSDKTILAKIGTEQHVPCFSTENNFNPNLGPLLNYQQESKLPMEDTSLQFPFLFSATVPGSGSVSFGMKPETVYGFRSSALLRAMVEFGEGDKMDYVSLQRVTTTGVDGVSLLAYSPMAMGILSGKYFTPGGGPPDSRMNLFRGRYLEGESRYNLSSTTVKAATERYLNIAEKYAIRPACLAIAFVMKHPLVGSVIFGATKVWQLRMVLEACKVRLTSEIIGEINRIHMMHPNPCP